MNSSNGSMNRMYRVVWNATTGVWQAVAEMAKGRGKTKSIAVTGAAVGGRLLDLRRSTLQAAVLAALGASATPVMAVAFYNFTPTTINTAVTGTQSAYNFSLATLNVTASGSVQATDAPAVSVSNSDDNANSTEITNAGTISASASISAPISAVYIATDDSYFGTGNLTLTNRGTISATSGGDATAIEISNQGGLTNINNETAGRITASSTAGGSAFGVRFSGADLSTDSFITNAGTITVTATGGNYAGVYATGIDVSDLSDSSTVSNSGTLTVSATVGHNAVAYATGIDVSDLYDSSSVSNSGTLTVTAAGGDDAGVQATGIDVGDLYDSSSVSNSGTLTVTATGGVDAGVQATGIDVSDLYDSSTVSNSGTLTVTATATGGVHANVYAKGINVGDLYSSASVSNSGTLTVSATGGDSAYTSSATGINADDLHDSSSVSNSGTLTVTATGGDNAYVVATGMDFDEVNDSSSVSNSGTLTVTATAGDLAYARATGMRLNELRDNASITNSGTITVNTQGPATANLWATGIIVSNGDSTANITNSGTITATINGAADGRAYSIYNDSSATIHNTATGKLNGNLVTGGTLNNAGTISLPHNASAFVRDFVNSGTLEIGLLTDGTTTTHSQLNTETATFNAGSKINVNVLAASTNQGLLVGQTLDNVVVASDTLTLNATPVVTDNSALLNFEFVQDGNNIDLNVVQGTTIVDATIAGSGNANAVSAAAALQAIQDAGASPAMNPVFAALNALPTDAAVAGAVNSFTPAVTTTAVGVGAVVANNVQNIVGQRQSINMLGASGLNSGDPLLANRTVWFKPYGSWGKQDDRGSLSGFNLKTGGVGLGFDGEYRRNQKLGVALFYTNADVDMSSVAQKADIDVITGLVYGNLALSDKTQFLFQGGYTQQHTDTSRAIELLGETARGSYTAKVLNVDLKVQHDVQVSERLLVQPTVSVTYRHFKTPSYKETGSSVNQQVDGFSRSQTTLGIGAGIQYALDTQSKLLGHVKLGRDTRSNAMIVNTSFEGAPGVKYATRSADNGLTSYELGLGFERRVSAVSSLNVSVSHQGQGGGFKNNGISATYSLKF